MKETTITHLAVAVIAFALGGATGALQMKWTADDSVRELRKQNVELAEDGRRLEAAAYVCMKYCEVTLDP